MLTELCPALPSIPPRRTTACRIIGVDGVQQVDPPNSLPEVENIGGQMHTWRGLKVIVKEAETVWWVQIKTI